jgi:hypothetical protein
MSDVMTRMAYEPKTQIQARQRAIEMFFQALDRVLPDGADGPAAAVQAGFLFRVTALRDDTQRPNLALLVPASDESGSAAGAD